MCYFFFVENRSIEALYTINVSRFFKVIFGANILFSRNLGIDT